MRARRLSTSILVIAAVVAATTACGRRGDLDTPYQAAVEAREEAERAGRPVPPAPTPPVEDRPFILDGLI